MIKKRTLERNKETFWWPKRTPDEWCQEWMKHGRIFEARIDRPNPCALRECPKRKIRKGETYYQAHSKKWIAHEDCVKRHAAKVQAEEQGRKIKEQDEAFKQNQRKKIIPMPTTMAPILPVTDISEAAYATPTKAPKSKPLPKIAAVAEVAASVPYGTGNSPDYVKLLIENAELRGFKQAIEMVLSSRKTSVADGVLAL